MHDHDLVLLPSGHNVELALTSPANESMQLAVLLHPWSWLGGNMNDPVLVHLLEPTLLAHGFHVLRYNSRGVGRSKGWPSLTGSQEVQDLHEIVQWALEKVPNVQHLLLVGYSHGSLITSQHPPLPLPSTSSTSTTPRLQTSHILLSYPLSPRPYLTLFHSSSHTTALTTLARSPASRVLVIYGDRDEFTAAGRYDAWARDLERQGRVGLVDAGGEGEGEGENDRGGRVTVARIEGASHFWAQDQDKAQEMLDVIQRWLDARQS